MNEYTFELRARCPVKPEIVDVYTATLRTDKAMILVEDILKAAKEVEGNAIYQEELTLVFATKFECECRLVGYHSGVRITSTTGTP